VNTTSDVTRSLNSVPEPGHSFAPKRRFRQPKKALSFGFEKIKYTTILSTFETTKWANKREYENFVSVAL